MWGLGISIEGRPLPAPGEGISAVFRVCLLKYFSTMGMSLLRGRDFSEQDCLGSPGVVIINQNLARRQFANEDPIGKRITLEDPRGNPEWLTIVGVVKDAKQNSWISDASNEIYLPWLQSKGYIAETGGHIAYMTLVIRRSGYWLNGKRGLDAVHRRSTPRRASDGPDDIGQCFHSARVRGFAGRIVTGAPRRQSRSDGGTAVRMTNDKCPMTKEIRNPNDEGEHATWWEPVRHSGFVIHSSFGFRHCPEP